MFPPTGFHLSMVSKATANGFPKCLASDLLWTNSKAGLAPPSDDVTERDDSAGQSSDESDGARMGRLSQQQGRTPALPKRHLSDHTGHVFIFLPTQREKPWIRKCSKLKGINNPDTNQSYPL